MYLMVTIRFCDLILLLITLNKIYHYDCESTITTMGDDGSTKNTSVVHDYSHI